MSFLHKAAWKEYFPFCRKRNRDQERGAGLCRGHQLVSHWAHTVPFPWVALLL